MRVSNSVRVFLTKNSVLTKKNHYLLKSDVFYVNIAPSIETHLAVMMGLPTKKFRPECVNEKSSTERRS